MSTSRGLSVFDSLPKDRDVLWLGPIYHSRAERDPWTSLVIEELDEGEPVEWSEADIVYLHWKLLKGIRALEDPGSSLDEKLDLLRWIFTDAEHDRRPFSFVFCLEVVGGSPFSPTEYGLLDPDEIRAFIRCHLRDWFDAAMKVYPPWVREIVVENPNFVATCLDKNPQWLNEQMSKRRNQGDLFM